MIKIFLFVLLSSFSYAIVVLWAFFKEQHTVPCWQGCRGKGLIQHNSKTNTDKLPGQLLAGKDISQGFLCICRFPLLCYFWKTTINSKIKVKSHSFNISFFLKWNFLCLAGNFSYIKLHLLWFTSLLLLPTEALYFFKPYCKQKWNSLKETPFYFVSLSLPTIKSRRFPHFKYLK